MKRLKLVKLRKKSARSDKMCLKVLISLKSAISNRKTVFGAKKRLKIKIDGFNF